MARASRRSHPPPANPALEFQEGVLSGRIVVGRLVRLAVEAHVRDLEVGAARGLWFDQDAARHALAFFALLKHSKGEWAGRQFELAPWQAWIVWALFGWRRTDGTRRYRTAYVEIARKNGKSTFAAGVALYLAFLDGEPGAEVYCAATKRDQALIVWGEAKRMVRSSPALSRHIRPFKANLSSERTGSKLEPLGADEDTLDGLNPNGAIIDELHAHKTRGVWDVLETAVGARRQPLIFAITTAGSDETSVCWEVHERCVAVLEGTLPDDSLFGFVASLDPEDDWTDERVWPKANPNLGISVKLDGLREAAEKAKTTPGAQNAFLRLRLNRWTRATTRFLALEAWDANSGDVEVIEIARRNEVEKSIAFGGLDLSSKTDLTAFVLVFPPDDRDAGVFDVLAWFWMPRDNVDVREKRDHVPYSRWIADGWIEATEGNVIDYRTVKNRVAEIANRFRIQEVAFDRWGALSIFPELDGEGLTMVEFGQGYKSMSPPTKELEKLVLGRQLRHGGNPVLRWMADCLEVKQDPAENLKPVKPDTRKSGKRIDGMVALIMAIARACTLQPVETSVYEERGVLVL